MYFVCIAVCMYIKLVSCVSYFCRMLWSVTWETPPPPSWNKHQSDKIQLTTHHTASAERGDHQHGDREAAAGQCREDGEHSEDSVRTDSWHWHFGSGQECLQEWNGSRSAARVGEGLYPPTLLLECKPTTFLMDSIPIWFIFLIFSPASKWRPHTWHNC